MPDVHSWPQDLLSAKCAKWLHRCTMQALPLVHAPYPPVLSKKRPSRKESQRARPRRLGPQCLDVLRKHLPSFSALGHISPTSFSVFSVWPFVLVTYMSCVTAEIDEILSHPREPEIHGMACGHFIVCTNVFVWRSGLLMIPADSAVTFFTASACFPFVELSQIQYQLVCSILSMEE